MAKSKQRIRYKLVPVQWLKPLYDPDAENRIKALTQPTEEQLLAALRERVAEPSSHQGVQSNFAHLLDTEDTEDQCRRTINYLRDGAGILDPESDLANLLSGCSDENDCGSAGCAGCAQRVRRLLCEMVDSALAPDERWAILSCFVPGYTFDEFPTAHGICSAHWHGDCILGNADVKVGVGWVSVRKFRLMTADEDSESSQTTLNLMFPLKNLYAVRDSIPTRYRVGNIVYPADHDAPLYSLSTCHVEWTRDPATLWRFFEPAGFKLVSTGPDEYLSLAPHEKVRRKGLSRWDQVQFASAFHEAGWGPRLILRGLKLGRNHDGCCLEPSNKAAASFLRWASR